MIDRVELKDFTEEVAIQICAVAYADKNKTNKKIMMYVSPVDKDVGFKVFKNGELYRYCATLVDAIKYFNEIV